MNFMVLVITVNAEFARGRRDSCSIKNHQTIIFLLFCRNPPLPKRSAPRLSLSLLPVSWLGAHIGRLCLNRCAKFRSQWDARNEGPSPLISPPFTFSPIKGRSFFVWIVLMYSASFFRASKAERLLHSLRSLEMIHCLSRRGSASAMFRAIRTLERESSGG